MILIEDDLLPVSILATCRVSEPVAMCQHCWREPAAFRCGKSALPLCWRCALKTPDNDHPSEAQILLIGCPCCCGGVQQLGKTR